MRTLAKVAFHIIDLAMVAGVMGMAVLVGMAVGAV